MLNKLQKSIIVCGLGVVAITASEPAYSVQHQSNYSKEADQMGDPASVGPNMGDEPGVGAGLDMDPDLADEQDVENYGAGDDRDIASFDLDEDD